MTLFCSLQTQGIGVTYSAVSRTRPAQWVCTQTGWKPKSRTSAPVQHQRWFQCTVRLLNLWWNSLILGQTLTPKVIPRLRSTDVLVWEIPSWASWMQSGGTRSLACKQSSVYIHPWFCPSYYMARRHGRYVSRTVRGSNPSIWCRNVEFLASDGSNTWQTPPFRRQQAWWTYHSSLPTDVTTCSATSAVCPRKLLFGEPCSCAPTSFNGDRPTPEWKRPRGRPRRSWLQQIEEDFGAPISVVYIAAQDRSNWRSLRPSTGVAHQWVSEWHLFREAYPWQGTHFWVCITFCKVRHDTVAVSPTQQWHI